MTGTRGPVPKRSEDRIRRNTPEVPIEKVTALGKVEVPELGLPDPHPLTVDIYNSLKESGQSRFFEPSDWAFARFALVFVDELVKDPGVRGAGPKLAVVHSMLGELLMSEGSRRRVRMEIQRQDGEPAKVTDIADVYRQRLANS